MTETFDKRTVEKCAEICQLLLDGGVDERISLAYPAHNRKANLSDAIKAIRALPTRGQAGVVVPREMLESWISALDKHLGDSDITHFERDEDYRDHVPGQWVCMQMSSALNASPQASEREERDPDDIDMPFSGSMERKA